MVSTFCAQKLGISRKKKKVSQIVVTGKKNVSQIVVTGKDFILAISSAVAARTWS